MSRAIARIVARAFSRIEHFLFAPARPAPLAALRIGLAATLLAQALQVAPSLRELYHHSGLLRGPLKDAFGPSHLPALADLVPALAERGATESAILGVCGLLYVASLIGMMVGWRTRATTCASWLLHLFFLFVSPHTNYGVDDFANIFLFYAMWAPGAGVLSLDRRAGRASDAPTEVNRLAMRVMQLHLCLVYLQSGVEKASGDQWWSGEAIWRSLMTQGYSLLDFTWLALYPSIAIVMGWAVLLIEIGYPVFIWPRRTRRLWVAAVAGMHAGIGIFMGLHVFGAVMIVLTVSMFGISAEPALARELAHAPPPRRS